MTSVKILPEKGMEKTVNKEIKQYLKEIKNLLPVYGRREKAFVAMIKTSVLETYSESNTVSYDMLCSEFGKPKDIVINYFAEADDEKFYKRICFSSIVKTAVGCIAAIAVAVAVFESILLYDSYQKGAVSVFTQEVIMIE